MTVQLMIDGGADIPASLKETIDMIEVPLYLHFKDEQYQAGVTMDLDTFKKRMKESDELPRSSAPSPNDFLEAYKKVDPETPIIMLSLSGGLSVTYENATLARSMLLEEEPDRKITVINTKTATCGIALLVQEAAAKLKEGLSYDDLVSHLQDRTEKITTLFVLRTLENLVRGGRVDKVKGTIAKTLNIKLLMKASKEGKIEVAEKVRGSKKSIRRFVDQIEEYTTNFEGKNIFMSHFDAEDRAKKVLSEIKSKYHFNHAYLTEMGPLIATYAGEGGMVITFFND